MGNRAIGGHGNLHHVALGALDALLDGGGHFEGLAQTEAHLAVAVSHHHEGGEGEVLATLHHLGDAADIDDLVLEFALCGIL